MVVDIEAPRVTVVPIEAITSRIQVRGVKPSGVERLKAKIEKMGFLPERPLLVVRKPDGTLELVDGNHRLDAVIPIGITNVPVHIIEEVMTDNEKKRRARQANEAAETLVPTTFVDDAEFVWGEYKDGEGKTQSEIADMLGWKIDKVTKYNLLSQITKSAWAIILTTFEDVVRIDEDEDVRSDLTGVRFTENLLRSIIQLRAPQQVELVSALANSQKSKMTKGKFNELAKAYNTRNQMKAYALPILGELGEDYTTKLTDEIYSGAYDGDWKQEAHPKHLRRLKRQK